MRTLAILMAALTSTTSAPAREPVRLAVVGLTHDHVFWLLHRPRDRGDVRIVGVWEPDAELAAERLADAGLDPAIHHTDLGAMLAATRPEAVCLFGSIRAHREQALRCIASGAHVMVEKPLAVNLADARTMADAAQRAGVHLLTNYETTWYASLHAAKRRLDEPGDWGDLGPVRRMVFRMGHGGPIEIGCRQPFLDWLLDPEENGGGAVTDFGCYGVNLATWLMNGERPTSVACVTKRLKPDLYRRVDDDATVTLEYAGAVAVVQASWNWPYGVKETRVYTTKADVLVPDARGATIRREDGRHEGITILDGPPDPKLDPFAHLAAVTRGDTAPNALSSVENNLIVMEVLDAARRSAATGERVSLPPDGPVATP